MGRIAKTVCTRVADIRRITRLIGELPSGERVRIVERNGQVLTGTVIERPAMQVFEDVHGKEGLNAVVRIDDPSAPPWNAELWLSDIRRVESLNAQNE